MARKTHLLPCVKATGWTITTAGRKKRTYDKPRTPTSGCSTPTSPTPPPAPGPGPSTPT